MVDQLPSPQLVLPQISSTNSMAENFLGGDGPLLGFPIEETCPKNPPEARLPQEMFRTFGAEAHHCRGVCVVGGSWWVKHLGGCWGLVER